MRAKNFKEVALGYTPAMAAEEAGRCIQCPKRPCVAGCPVNIDIPEFIKAVRDGKMAEAVTVLKKYKCFTGYLRPRLPAGIPMRSTMHITEAKSPGGHRAFGTLCSGLGTGK